MFFYKELKTLYRFNSFWLALSLTILSIIVGFKEDVLNGHLLISEEGKNKSLEFHLKQLVIFPLDDLKNNRINEITFENSLSGCNHYDYTIIVDISKSTDHQSFDDRYREEMIDYIMENVNKNNDYLKRDEVERLKPEFLFSFFIGYYLSSDDLKVPHSKIDVKYYVDIPGSTINIIKPPDATFNDIPTWVDKLRWANSQVNSLTENEQSHPILEEALEEIYNMSVNKSSGCFHTTIFISDFNFGNIENKSELIKRVSNKYVNDQFPPQINIVKIPSRQNSKSWGCLTKEDVAMCMPYSYFYSIDQFNLNSKSIVNTKLSGFFSRITNPSRNILKARKQSPRFKATYSENRFEFRFSGKGVDQIYLPPQIKNPELKLNQDDIGFDDHYRCFELSQSAENDEFQLAFKGDRIQANQVTLDYVDFYSKDTRTKSRYYVNRIDPINPALSRIWMMLITIIFSCMICFVLSLITYYLMLNKRLSDKVNMAIFLIILFSVVLVMLLNPLIYEYLFYYTFNLIIFLTIMMFSIMCFMSDVGLNVFVKIEPSKSQDTKLPATTP